MDEDPYLKLIDDLVALGEGYTFTNVGNPVQRGTYQPYMVAASTDWTVWVTRVIAAVRRRFKDDSAPVALLKKAQSNPIEGYGQNNFNLHKSFVLGALKSAKALVEDEIRFGSPQGPATVVLQARKADAPVESPNVFVVHGHDEEMKQAVSRALDRLGLKPIVLHEKPDMGRTVIEKFSDYSDVLFAIVLLSGDDMGRSKATTSERPRARQNVILELGFFLGKLGRTRVLPLYRPAAEFELPSDVAGVLYKPFDGTNSWQFELCKELQAAGYKVDANRLLA